MNLGCCSQVCSDPSMRRSSWQRTSLSMSGIDISHPNNCLNRPPPPLPRRRLCFLCSGELPTGLIFEAAACVESMHRNRDGRVSGSGSDRPVDRTDGKGQFQLFIQREEEGAKIVRRSLPALSSRRSFFPLCDASTKVDSARGGSAGV